MPDNNGGDGTAMGPTGEEPIVAAPPITGDVSSTPEELNLKIEQELGLPHTEVKPEETRDADDAAKVDDKDAGTDDGDGSDGAGEAGEQPAKTVDTPPAEPTDKEFFIEVEDAEGVTHKISKIEDLPEDFVAKNNRQGYEILRNLDKLDNERESYEKQQAEDAQVAEQTRIQTEQFDAWDREVDELSKSKRIDIADTDRVNKVFEHMNKVNTARIKANNPNLITSFEDALDKYEKVEAADKASDKKKQDNDRAKAKASLIGGGNSTGAGASQPYYSGRYRSMDDVPVN